jgi:hypothetical protein
VVDLPEAETEQRGRTVGTGSYSYRRAPYGQGGGLGGADAWEWVVDAASGTNGARVPQARRVGEAKAGRAPRRRSRSGGPCPLASCPDGEAGCCRIGS